MHKLRTYSGLRRTGVVLALGAVVLGGSFATAAAFNGRAPSSGDHAAVPDPSTPVATPAPVVTPDPVTPEPVETAAPIETGDPVVAPDPTDDAVDVPSVISLETADGANVTVDLTEIVDLLDAAASGHPAEGMSVEPYTLQLENLDDRTLKLTWVDFGIDNELALYRFQEGKVLVMVQPEPDGAVDAMGFDRELILTFKEPISADDLQGFLQGGLDTPGDDAA